MADRDKIGEFILGAERLAEQHGVPILDSAMMLSIAQFRNEAMHHAGAMEAQGATFAEQQKALAKKLIELHQKA